MPVQHNLLKGWDLSLHY